MPFLCLRSSNESRVVDPIDVLRTLFYCRTPPTARMERIVRFLVRVEDEPFRLFRVLVLEMGVHGGLTSAFRVHGCLLIFLDWRLSIHPSETILPSRRGERRLDHDSRSMGDRHAE